MGTHWNFSLIWVDTAKRVTALAIPLFYNSTIYMNEVNISFACTRPGLFIRRVAVAVFAEANQLLVYGSLYWISHEV